MKLFYTLLNFITFCLRPFHERELNNFKLKDTENVIYLVRHRNPIRNVAYAHSNMIEMFLSQIQNTHISRHQMKKFKHAFKAMTKTVIYKTRNQFSTNALACKLKDNVSQMM